jgi:hypothetical protein
MLVIRVPCLLEKRFEGLKAPSNCPVIDNALIPPAKATSFSNAAFSRANCRLVKESGFKYFGI